MKDEFLITRSGKQFVLFAGLLDEAHNRGLKEIDTDLVQVPTPENGNVAVVKAVAVIENERDGLKRFSGIGDASPDNVGRNIVPHIIRMAETRAKARALRDAINVGVTALEELSDGDTPPSSSGARATSISEKRQSKAPKADAPLTDTQVKRILQLSNEKFPGGVEEMQQKVEWLGGSDYDTISQQSAERLINDLQQMEDFTPDDTPGVQKGGAKGSKGTARKSQVDLLKTLAVELRGEGGVERFEEKIGKPVEELTREEADDWIDKLTPQPV